MLQSHAGGKLFFGGGAGVNACCNPSQGKCTTTQSRVLDIFDVASKQFVPTPPPLSAGRSFLAAVAIEAARLVLFGGGEKVPGDLGMVFVQF